MIAAILFCAYLIGLCYVGDAYGWAVAAIAFVVWVLGFFASLGLMHRLAKPSPYSHEDCFSGDDGLDLTLAALWPVFWPCYAAYQLGHMPRSQ